MNKPWHISRRRMLKGLGATIALPFLEAMIPPGVSAFTQKSSPVRSAFLFMPNGVHPDMWTPTQFGNNFELSPILSPLKNVKDDIIVLNELMNHYSIFKGADGHYAKTANFLTCLPIYKTTGESLHSGGISIDQLIAKHVGNQTLFPSLEYGLERINSGIDVNVGFTRLYGSAISWKSPSQPNSKEIDPKLAFDRLFRNYVPLREGETRQLESAWKGSVLDLVLEDANSLQKQLGRADQDKLAEYLESIRAIEKRIENEGKRKDFEANITPDIVKELGRLNQRIDEFSEMNLGVDITEKVRQMLDIMVLAFWSDATRVTSFMFGNSVSNRNFSFLPGVEGSHHQLSHHQNDAKNMTQYAMINTWHMEQYAYFLEKLKSIKEGDKTLLENSMVMIGSGLRDGNRHSPRNLPIVLAGQAGGSIKTGKNLLYKEETPLANLYLTMLHALDIPANCFADSTSDLCDIYT